MSSTETAIVDTNGYAATQARIDNVTNNFINLSEAEAYHVASRKQEILMAIKDYMDNGYAWDGALESESTEDAQARITNMLLAAGYGSGDVKKILGGNEVFSSEGIQAALAEVNELLQNGGMLENMMKFYFLEGTYDQITLQKLYEALTSEGDAAKRAECLKMLYGDDYENFEINKYDSNYWIVGIGSTSFYGQLRQAEEKARLTGEYEALYGEGGTEDNPIEGSLKAKLDATTAALEAAYYRPLFNERTYDEIVAVQNAAQANLDNCVDVKAFDSSADFDAVANLPLFNADGTPGGTLSYSDLVAVDTAIEAAKAAIRYARAASGTANSVALDIYASKAAADAERVTEAVQIAKLTDSNTDQALVACAAAACVASFGASLLAYHAADATDNDRTIYRGNMKEAQDNLQLYVNYITSIPSADPDIKTAILNAFENIEHMWDHYVAGGAKAFIEAADACISAAERFISMDALEQAKNTKFEYNSTSGKWEIAADQSATGANIKTIAELEGVLSKVSYNDLVQIVAAANEKLQDAVKNGKNSEIWKNEIAGSVEAAKIDLVVISETKAFAADGTSGSAYTYDELVQKAEEAYAAYEVDDSRTDLREASRAAYEALDTAGNIKFIYENSSWKIAADQSIVGSNMKTIAELKVTANYTIEAYTEECRIKFNNAKSTLDNAQSSSVFKVNGEMTSIAKLRSALDLAQNSYEHMMNTAITFPEDSAYTIYNGKTLAILEGMIGDPKISSTDKAKIEQAIAFIKAGGVKFGSKTLADLGNEAKVAQEVYMEAERALVEAQAYDEKVMALATYNIRTQIVEPIQAAINTYLGTLEKGTIADGSHWDGIQDFGRKAAKKILNALTDSLENAKTMDDLVQALKDFVWHFNNDTETYTFAIDSIFDKAATSNFATFFMNMLDARWAAPAMEHNVYAAKDLYNTFVSKMEQISYFVSTGNVTFELFFGGSGPITCQYEYNSAIKSDDELKKFLINVDAPLDSFDLSDNDYVMLAPFFSTVTESTRTNLSDEKYASLWEAFNIMATSASNASNEAAAYAAKAQAAAVVAEGLYNDQSIDLLDGTETDERVNGSSYVILVHDKNIANEAYLNALKLYMSTREYDNLMTAQLSFSAEEKVLSKLNSTSGATMDDLLELCLMASTPQPSSSGEYRLVTGVQKVETKGEDGAVNYEYKLVYDEKSISEAVYQDSFSKSDGYKNRVISYLAMAIMYEKVCLQQLVLVEQMKQVEKINEQIHQNNEIIKALSWMYGQVYKKVVDGATAGQNREGSISSADLYKACGITLPDLQDYLQTTVKNGGIDTIGDSSLRSNYTTSYGLSSGNQAFKYAVGHYNKDGERWEAGNGAHSKDISNIDVQEQAALTFLTNLQDQTRLCGDKLSADANLMTTKMQQYIQESNACINIITQLVKSVGDITKGVASNVR
ncbi:MAG: hypothetical protein LBI56_02715 [Puniceicoccales bacterium]|jgi:hypothetical protein|nr:hypothetical protein [Puniceicoccales bacterium]